ncbi:MAG: hypothetical protein KAT70_06000 [Thermoplasmata archaeon]|nr:hypothetical protein [Thermoplasmata archaeon]
MEIELVEKTANEITVSFLDSDESFVYLILEELWEDKKVVNAEYKKSHPTLDTSTLKVRVSEGKPQTALKRAAKSLSTKVKAIKDGFEKVAG